MDNRILQEAADVYGTPSYVFDLDAFTRRIHAIRKILGHDIRIYYAMKANPFLTAAAAQAADGLEVCSPGEYAICRRAGISPEKIVLSGVNKEPGHIREIMKAQGAGTFTAESPGQLKVLEACAACGGNTPVRVLLRLTSGNQFGMDEDTIESVIRDRGSYPHLDMIGLQYYSGTQKKHGAKIGKELERLDIVLCKIRDELLFEFQELEYGPGFLIPYFKGEEGTEEMLMLRDFRDSLHRMAFKGHISIEAGRFLAAPCGSYVTKIVDLKHSQGQNYCIVDGGINHVNYYGQAMAMKIPPYRFISRKGPGQSEAGLSGVPEPVDLAYTANLHPTSESWTVCGSLCTSGDILVKNLPLPGLKGGDLLVFDSIGAYSVTEGIYLFLSRNLPRILTFTKSGGLCLVRRAIPTDMLNDGSINLE